MTLPTSNIVFFPNPNNPPAPALPSPAEGSIASVCKDKVAPDEYAAHVATVVGTSIDFARRKGIRLDSLPPQLRTWLLDLCGKGDPTCKMVRDWLTGNHRFGMSQSQEDA